VYIIEWDTILVQIDHSWPRYLEPYNQLFLPISHLSTHFPLAIQSPGYPSPSSLVSEVEMWRPDIGALNVLLKRLDRIRDEADWFDASSMSVVTWKPVRVLQARTRRSSPAANTNSSDGSIATGRDRERVDC